MTPAPPAGSASSAAGFVPESLVPACIELEEAFRSAWADPSFHAEFEGILGDYGGRPTPVTECGRLSEELGIRVLLKREDLAHTGSHKLNNVVGQGLLARRMGKRRLIAETGAGQHGVATRHRGRPVRHGVRRSTWARWTPHRQELNVFRMELLGAEVRPVPSGSRTLKDAVNEALRDWVAVGRRHPLLRGIGDGAPSLPVDGPRVPAHHRRRGPGPVPHLLGGADPDVVVACAGGGSNAAGIFAGFADDTSAALVAVEAAGGAAMTTGVPGVLHGMRSALMQDEAGQILEAHSISAGLGLPGHRPRARPSGCPRPGPLRVRRRHEVLEAFQRLARTEGIIPALESAHALAWVMASAGTEDLPSGSTVLVNLSGRGDKDVAQVRDIFRS